MRAPPDFDSKSLKDLLWNLRMAGLAFDQGRCHASTVCFIWSSPNDKMDDYDEALSGLIQLMIRNQLSEVLAPVRRRKNITLHEHSANNLLPEIPNTRHSALCHGASRRFGCTIEGRHP